MINLKFFFLTFLIIQILESQALNLEFDDLIVEYMNDKYYDTEFSEMSVNYKKPRNTLKLKLKVIKDFPLDLKADIYVLGGVMGHYKFPMFMQSNLDYCDPATYDFYFDEVLKHIGMTKEECPAKKGEYVNEDYYPVIDGVPDIPKTFVQSSVRSEMNVYSVSEGDMLKVKIFVKF